MRRRHSDLTRRAATDICIYSYDWAFTLSYQKIGMCISRGLLNRVPYNLSYNMKAIIKYRGELLKHTSILPLHLSTKRSIRISKSSESLRALCVITTALLNSSNGLPLSAVLFPFDNLTSDPHLSWKRNLSCLGVSSGILKLKWEKESEIFIY